MKNNKLHDERRTGIGGSDVAACFNLDRGCARKLVYEKRGTTPDYPDPYRPEYERGKDLEPVAREKYQRETGRKVSNAGAFLRDETYPHMIVHVDGMIENNVQPDNPGLLEIKVLNKWMLQRIKKSGLSEGFMLQNQHGMYVGGFNWSEWGLLCPDPWEMFVVQYERDDGIIKTIIEQEEQIWKQITNGPMPDKLDPKDARCQTCPYRKQCQGSEMMQAIKAEDAATPLEEDASISEMAEEYWQAREIAEQAEALKKEAGERLKKAIGKRPGLKYPGGRFLLSRSYPVRWDTEALWASLDLFPLLEKYLKETPQDKPQLTLRGYRTGD